MGETEEFYAAQLLDLGNVGRHATAVASYEGTDKVVFWPPRPDNVGFNLLNSDEDTNGHWGMNWPVKVLSSKGNSYTVQYDNGAIGNVLAEHVSPKAWNEAPVPFGGEATPLEICEFAEVFNGSEEDPGSWPAVVTNLLVGGGYKVFFPFHPTECREQIAAEKIRRYRVWKGGEWRLIHPKCWKAFDRWRGTTIMQPMDLKSIREDELPVGLACKFGCARCRYAGVGCLSCDFNRPNYRGIFQARLLPQFLPQLPAPEFHQAQPYQGDAAANINVSLPTTVKKEVSPQPMPSRRSWGKQANPVREDQLLEPVSRFQASPSHKAQHSAQRKSPCKERRPVRQGGVVGGVASGVGGGASRSSCGAQYAQKFKMASQQARQWALARAHAQANAEALAREHRHAQGLLEQELQESSQGNGIKDTSGAELAEQEPGHEGQVGHKRPHNDAAAEQQASEKRQRLVEEVERKRQDAESAERELEALMAKEAKAESTAAEAAKVRQQATEAQEQLAAQERKMEQELRKELQAQLELQLQAQLEKKFAQPRLNAALLENAALIAENTAAQAAREMELL